MNTNIIIKVYQLLLFFYKYKRYSLNFLFKIKKLDLKYLEIFNFGSENVNNFVKKKILHSKFYFEYGAGATTFYAIKNKKKFISIESDLKFIKIFKKYRSVRYIDIGPTGKFSYPIFLNKKKFLKYIFSFDKFIKKKKFPDFILIDGRFRVAVALNLLKYYENISKNNTIIVLDDYKKRKNYGVLNRFYSIKLKGRIAILKPKINIFPKNELYKNIIDPR